MTEFSFTVLDSGIETTEMAEIMSCCWSMMFPGR
jgi:putative radical SAM-modified peptide